MSGVAKHWPLEERVDSYDQQEVLSRMQTTARRFRLTKPELTTHFAHQLGVKPTVVRAFFAELERLAAYELMRAGEFVVPEIAKVVVQRRWARMGRHPWTGEWTRFPAKKTVLKARVAGPLKDAVLSEDGF